MFVNLLCENLRISYVFLALFALSGDFFVNFTASSCFFPWTMLSFYMTDRIKTTRGNFMKARNFILSFFGRTCAAAVALSMIFYIFMEIAYASSLELERGISFSQFLLLLLCAACLSASAFLFLLPLPKIANLLLNYIASFLSFYIIFSAAGKFFNFLATWLLFTVFYAVFWGLFLLFRFLFYPEKRREKSKAEAQKEAEYVNRF